MLSRRPSAAADNGFELKPETVPAPPPRPVPVAAPVKGKARKKK
jgi:hypothetical protein